MRKKRREPPKRAAFTCYKFLRVEPRGSSKQRFGLPTYAMAELRVPYGARRTRPVSVFGSKYDGKFRVERAKVVSITGARGGRYTFGHSPIKNFSSLRYVIGENVFPNGFSPTSACNQGIHVFMDREHVMMIVRREIT